MFAPRAQRDRHAEREEDARAGGTGQAACAYCEKVRQERGDVAMGCVAWRRAPTL